DIDDGAADGATAHLALELLQGGHQFWIVPVHPAKWSWCRRALGARWGGRPAGGAWGVGMRGSTMSMSWPVAARASSTRSSATARRMPRLRWARMIERLSVPKPDAMTLRLGAVARWRTVATRWRP